MGTGKLARTAGVALLALGIGACGGGGGKSEAERAKEGAEQAARTLAENASGDTATACRTLTLATRRVIGRLATSGGSCSTTLSAFTSTFGLNPGLSRAEEFAATVTGDRASVEVDGIADPLTAVRTGDQWRVSLIGLPGVRGDLAAAEACSGYLRRSDALGLPGRERAAVLGRLTRQARLVAGFRRALADLPTGGPERRDLPALLRSLTRARSELLRAARRVRQGRDLHDPQVTAAFADRAVRGSLREVKDVARIGCPRDVYGEGGALVLSSRLAPRCRAAARDLDALTRRGSIDSLAELRGYLGEGESIVRGLADDLDGGALPPALRRVRGQGLPRPVRRVQQQGVRALEELGDVLARLGTASSQEAYEAIAEGIDPLAGQGDAALAQLGVACSVPRAVPDTRERRLD